jgi:protein-S-isoprenylcysteine O-methyltransferase Ste14
VFKLIIGVVIQVAIFGGLLFLPAGTLGWWRALVFIGVVLINSLAMVGLAVTIFPLSDDLLYERYKSPIQKGQPLADKIVVSFFIVTFFGLIVFIPLDVFRFHLMSKPGTIVSSLGLVLFVAGWWIIYFALEENAFAVPVVKLQEERHQTVIDTGVYGIVRHPMYAGSVLLLVGMPLWLESYAAVLLAGVPIGTLVLRIMVEERFLRRELKGYDAYLERVRYRLIPFLW